MRHLLPALALAALLLSCDGDGAAPDGACACEPPLAGRITTSEGFINTGDEFVRAAAVCPAGSTILGGGCEVETERVLMELRESGKRGAPASYGCAWQNPNLQQVTVRAWATCLQPAS